MVHPITLNQAIDTVTQLPLQQQEMLLDILRHRLNEARRQEIADAARQAQADFQQGRLTAKSADAVIQDLHRSLEEEA
ncbi:hypothetical protein [Halochromatium salexigens]|uniref:Addiction module component n=1 Tax=Halochromatium salexigens TaxID=49447 RepID=A0AAJ0UKG5_HALSE|nr:hypothetical protein [Halochromatium salexigens]MBK5931882.1 hypothetical protein [Halochromatium salexigens]